MFSQVLNSHKFDVDTSNNILFSTSSDGGVGVEGRRDLGR